MGEEDPEVGVIGRSNPDCSGTTVNSGFWLPWMCRLPYEGLKDGCWGKRHGGRMTHTGCCPHRSTLLTDCEVEEFNFGVVPPDYLSWRLRDLIVRLDGLLVLCMTMERRHI